ncbi:MAG: EF-hand domain-containing protein [Candidatus Sericytochromatia bacterium]
MKKALILLSLSMFFGCAQQEFIEPSIEQVDALAVKPTESQKTKLMKSIVDKKFTFLDKNKDKNLNRAEYDKVESEHDDVIDEMFKENDLNKDGKVSYDEFSKLYLNAIDNSMKQGFAMTSRMSTKNDLIDTKEEYDILIEMSQSLSNYAMKIEDIQKEFEKYDEGKDKVFNYAEQEIPSLKFILMMNPDPYASESIKNSAKKLKVDLRKILKNEITK